MVGGTEAVGDGDEDEAQCAEHVGLLSSSPGPGPGGNGGAAEEGSTPKGGVSALDGAGAKAQRGAWVEGPAAAAAAEEGEEDSGGSSVRWALYGSHALSAWGQRMWEFATGLVCIEVRCALGVLWAGCSWAHEWRTWHVSPRANESTRTNAIPPSLCEGYP
jgi:hypothetical protein